MKTLVPMLTLLTAPLIAQQNVLIPAPGATLNTWVYPRENAETVILLHGGPGVPDPMTPVIGLLKDQFQVVYFQQRGTGTSVCSSGSYTVEDYIADLDAVANYLQLEKFHLFGHSWGGLYAQIYAQERPQRLLSLFLCSPSSGTGDLWKQTEQEVMRFNKSVTTNWQWLGMGWRSMLGVLGSDRAYQRLFHRVLQNYNVGFAVVPENNDWLAGVAAEPVNKTRKSILNYAPLHRMDNCPFPVTITYGERDIYGESRRQVPERYPTANAVMIENAGHLPWTQQPERFRHILEVHFRPDI